MSGLFGESSGEEAKAIRLTTSTMDYSVRSSRALLPLLEHLRGLGVAPGGRLAPRTAVDEVIGEFEYYLVHERGLVRLR